MLYMHRAEEIEAAEIAMRLAADRAARTPADDRANALRCAQEDMARAQEDYEVACRKLGKANKIKSDCKAFGRAAMQGQAMREINAARRAMKAARIKINEFRDGTH